MDLEILKTTGWELECYVDEWSAPGFGEEPKNYVPIFYKWCCCFHASAPSWFKEELMALEALKIIELELELELELEYCVLEKVPPQMVKSQKIWATISNVPFKVPIKAFFKRLDFYKIPIKTGRDGRIWTFDH